MNRLERIGVLLTVVFVSLCLISFWNELSSDGQIYFEQIQECMGILSISVFILFFLFTAPRWFYWIKGDLPAFFSNYSKKNNS